MAHVTERLDSSRLERAAELLREGQVVAFPTETVYGLGANAMDERAVRKIFAAKGRPADNPLIIHCSDPAQLESLVRPWPDDVQTLMDRFWPGPLTLVLPKQPGVPLVTTGGLATAAVRIPDHPVALELLRLTNLPIAAPSANVSGRPSPTRAEHVYQDLDGRIAAVVDAGPTGWGVESTVLDCTERPFRLLRPGGVTLEALQESVSVTADSGIAGPAEGPVRSPGMKYRHYAPECRVTVVVGEHAQEAITRWAAADLADGHVVGIMAFSEHLNGYGGIPTLDMGSQYALQEGASRLYHLLREADVLGWDTLYVEGMPEKELGLAIMNRLRRAAEYRVVDATGPEWAQ